MTGGWDRRGISPDPTVLRRLAELLDVPGAAESTWRAATVVLFATEPIGVTSACLHHVHDLDWPVPEEALIRQTIALLLRRRPATERSS